MGKEIKMEDFRYQVDKDIFEKILSYSDDLIAERDTLVNSIKSLDNLIIKIGESQPQYIEHVLRRDKMIQMKSSLTSILNSFDIRIAESRKNIPLKFRISHLFKNLFK
jgi:hypothetical protein